MLLKGAEARVGRIGLDGVGGRRLRGGDGAMTGAYP